MKVNTNEVVIIDDLHPEDEAMLQALYSRSSSSVRNHLEKIDETSTGEFMKKFYVGYGHKSIGDCGTTTIFIEGVSSLAAKAIQDNKLYKGQETSSRYVSFENQPILDPIKSEESKHIIIQWMMLYKSYLPKVILGLKVKYPHSNFDVSEKVWLNTINAKAFDIMRGFLPAGMTTQLSWHTDLRQANDKCLKLLNHPLLEVRLLATNILAELERKYPSSFNNKRINNYSDHYTNEGRYAFTTAEKENYLDLNYINYDVSDISQSGVIDAVSTINSEFLLYNESDVLFNRPKHMELPKYLEKYGQIKINYLLDWGSFRDIQRHRNCTSQIPLLKNLRSNHLDINSWYTDSIKSVIAEICDEIEFEQFIGRLQQVKNNTLEFTNDLDKYTAQYYFPFGTQLLCELTLGLPELIYIYELRSSKAVHPTLRRLVKEFKQIIDDISPTIATYGDLSDDEFLISRGTQTITEK